MKRLLSLWVFLFILTGLFIINSSAAEAESFNQDSTPVFSSDSFIGSLIASAGNQGAAPASSKTARRSFFEEEKNARENSSQKEEKPQNDNKQVEQKKEAAKDQGSSSVKESPSDKSKTEEAEKESAKKETEDESTKKVETEKPKDDKTVSDKSQKAETKPDKKKETEDVVSSASSANEEEVSQGDNTAEAQIIIEEVEEPALENEKDDNLHTEASPDAKPVLSNDNDEEQEDDTSAPAEIEKPDLSGDRPAPEQQTGAKITAIEVSGNKHISTGEILDVVRSRVGEPILEPRIRSDLQAIFEMGYFTDIKWDSQYYAGGIKIIFRVQENPMVTKITILGNKIVSTEQIRQLMQTKEGKILNMKTLNLDMAEINYYYDESLGYQLKPTHIKDVNYTTDGELVITIQEGLTVSKVEVTGSTLFSDEKLHSLVTMKEGDLLNTKQIRTDTTAIAKFYEEEGYILDTARPQIDYETGVVTFQVIEAVVEEIRVEIEPVKGRQKVKTREYVVRRNIRTQVGEVLQQRKIKRDIERLNNLGYFSKVNMEPEPGSKPGNVILAFKLEEQKTGLATLGVGYAGGGSSALRSGITGAISYTEKNLGGTGQGVSFSWQRGVNVDALTGGYSNPAVNANQDSISVNLFRYNYMELRQPLSNDFENSRYALYDDKRYGGAFVYGRRITDDFRLFMSLRHEQVDIVKNKNSDYEPIGMSKGTLNALGLGAFYDTRNDIFDPTDGFYTDASFTKSGGFMGGSYDFEKYQLEVRKYIPIGRKNRSTIALRAWGGLIEGRADKMPVTETFYVGGTDTVRGYAQNEFFGTRMVVLNAEYRFPIANIKFLKGAVFADAGNAWFPEDKRQKLYADAGAGLRIVFPTLGLGVIRVDYASGERGGRTSIGIGQTF